MICIHVTPPSGDFYNLFYNVDALAPQAGCGVIMGILLDERRMAGDWESPATGAPQRDTATAQRANLVGMSINMNFYSRLKIFDF